MTINFYFRFFDTLLLISTYFIMSWRAISDARNKQDIQL